MFTGIIEQVGEVVSLVEDKGNLEIGIKSSLAPDLKVDQSVSHNGVCLTVVEIEEQIYKVTAINETLEKSTLSKLKVGSKINLERAMKIGDRLDGHIVQGHVDQIAYCTAIEDQNGSWLFTFKYDTSLNNITIEKGSITVNGVSLTVVNSQADQFSVAIIPYTYQYTNFCDLQITDAVNLEFDVVGKYVSKILKQYQ